jgi:ATP/maltotriose-dependent transcriptional regulator MalT
MPVALDAHPLIREYFAKQLRETQPQAFKAAHSRLFDHLCQNTPHRPDTIEGLAPLYQAVVHGCLAGRQQEACDQVYFDRILRGTDDDGFYSIRKLGAIGADLAAVAAFFDEPWSKVSPNLKEADRAWLLNEAAYRLRALGRPAEATEPMRAGLEMAVRQQNWKNAAICASNLSELELTLGRLAGAVADAQASVQHADRSDNLFVRIGTRTTAADALHQSSNGLRAGELFAEAEGMRKKAQPEFEWLHSLPGFQYCDWLLAPVARKAWTGAANLSMASECTIVEHRARTTLGWAEGFGSLLSIALNRLTLARVGLIRAILSAGLPQPALDLPELTAAVNGLRSAGQSEYLVLALLTAAWYHAVRGEAELARNYLDEAWQIAERGPMPLYMADIHLHRARLFRDKGELAKAGELIRKLGYGRRYDELADAEAAAAAW